MSPHDTPAQTNPSSVGLGEKWLEGRVIAEPWTQSVLERRANRLGRRASWQLHPASANLSAHVRSYAGAAVHVRRSQARGCPVSSLCIQVGTNGSRRDSPLIAARP